MATMKTGGEIVARTQDGELVKGTEVMVEKPDWATRVAQVFVPLPGWLPPYDATTTERFVDAGDGNLQPVKEVIARE